MSSKGRFESEFKGSDNAAKAVTYKEACNHVDDIGETVSALLNTTRESYKVFDLPVNTRINFGSKSAIT